MSLYSDYLNRRRHITLNFTNVLEDIFVAVDNGVPFCKADDCAHVGSAMAVNNYLVLLVVEKRKHETTL